MKSVATTLVVMIFLVLPSACGGGEKEPSRAGSPRATEEASPTAAPSEATEAALREAVTTYERAFARFDLETAYALESAEFRETCSFEEYDELIAADWPQFLENCGFSETSEIDFVVENVKMGENWAGVYGCYQDETGDRCCYADNTLWDYRDDRWVLGSTLPCVQAQENKRLLASLPELPGAEQVSTESTLYSTEYEGVVNRHAIRVTYKAPRGMSAQDVINFYVQGLAPEWQHVIEDLTVRFAHGTAEISVSALSSMAPTFIVHVDSKGAEPIATPVPAAEIAERDAKTREILLESEVGETLLAGREEGRDYWIIDMSQVRSLVRGERVAMVVIAFAEPVFYQGEIPTVSDPCWGTRGEFDPDDPCHDEPWLYGTKYATFSNMREFHFTVEVDRGELRDVFGVDTPPEIVDDMIEWAKSTQDQ